MRSRSPSTWTAEPRFGRGAGLRIDSRRFCRASTGSDIVRSLLDPRAPLVLDTRELGRRPGSQRMTSFSAEAPAELGIEVLGVPEGSPVQLDLRLEAVMDGVLVTGTASV